MERKEEEEEEEEEKKIGSTWLHDERGATTASLYLLLLTLFVPLLFS